MSPRLTVITPVTLMAGRLQRLKHWVAECIELDIEVILIHDIRDAATESELRAIESQYKSNLVKVFTEKIGSPGMSRNLGLQYATGPWISFWDSDDQPIPAAFTKLVENADSAEKKVAIGSFQAMAELDENQKSMKIYGAKIEDIGWMPGIWRFSFRRDFIGSTRFTQYRMGEDQVFLAGLDLSIKDTYQSADVVYLYDDNFQGQLTKNLAAIADIKQAYKEILDRKQGVKSSNELAIVLLSKLMLTGLKNGAPADVWDWIKDFKRAGSEFGNVFYMKFIKTLIFLSIRAVKNEK